MLRSVAFYILIVVFGVSSAVGAPVQDAEDWWQTEVFYQIYPRSFKDSNNDGIGDLKGITSKLDHFKDMGVTATWLSPIYKSPQVDQGYDISDYRNIDPDYGTLDDFKELLEKAKELGIKIIMDLVPNHTSDKHQWFIESENGNETYKDFYVWHDGIVDEATGERKPPNNWISLFKHSAWKWSEKRKQYYLHQFVAQQPDLNYRNPAVVEAIKDVIVYWLDMGVSGFRVDAVPYLFEDEQLRDEPKSNNPNATPDDYEYLDHIYTMDLNQTFEMIYYWRSVVDNYTKEHGGDARILMTEAYTTTEKTVLYYGTKDGSKLGAHFTFNFLLLNKLNINSTATDYEGAINEWLHALPEIYTSNWVVGNHDNHRVATRLGVENIDGVNMLVSTLPGVGVTYNGEEIGQENGEVKYEEGKDPSARDPKIFDKVSRDFERTPFQWDTTVNAGFNEGAKPWLPVSKKYTVTNLAAQSVAGVKSHYSIYKQMLALRQDELLQTGETKIQTVSNVLIVSRTVNDATIGLLFNVGNSTESLDVATIFDGPTLHVLVSSLNSKHETGDQINTHDTVQLQPHEAIVIRNYIK